MTIDTVAVTGGNGFIGEAIIAHLSEHGYRTVNVARGKRRESVSDAYVTADLTEAGDVYGALAHAEADAVVHMGTLGDPTSTPEHVTYGNNAMSSYHVLEAATALGYESIVLPSSINALGGVFQDAPTDVRYLPVDETHPATPRDPYALGKRTIELLGEGFGRRPETPSIVAIRYPLVVDDAGLETFAAEADGFEAEERAPDVAKRADPGNPIARDDLFTYLHVEDAAAVARRAVEAAVDGSETVWAVAADTSVPVPSAELADRHYPDAEVRRPLSGTESLVSTERAREVLGWEPRRSWRDLR